MVWDQYLKLEKTKRQVCRRNPRAITKATLWQEDHTNKLPATPYFPIQISFTPDFSPPTSPVWSLHPQDNTL
ncbi:hypothetical protein ACN38_g6747 [Penicillium nordicum]|uniref:Uncharacterized protein n=1 Tax=Penicillium nordicum TaxID=229535 RepID=A0A0M8P2V3_9EURO|nr:hypothetical protein ACN38_g6747 [Penicillium nordicum]